MRYAIDVAPLGDLADPVAIVRLAKAAEASGWDGLSTWDSLAVSMGTVAADPFVALAAVAAATERLRLILSVAVLPRRRPQLLVQSAGTLDRISGGRLVLGIGAGADAGDFAAFGEGAPLSERVARMDAALPVVDRWLRGEAAHLDLPGASDVLVGPRPVQQPRPPIWFGGMRPGALRRAARWDGWIALAVSDDGSEMVLAPETLAEMIARVRVERESVGLGGEPFDVAIFAFSEPGKPGAPAAFERAGATWWLESLSPMRGSLEELLAIVEAGPPRGA